MAKDFLNGRVRVFAGDSREVLAGLPDASFDSVVTDPPYALVSIVKRFGKDGAAACIVPENGTGAYARASAGFMGKQWDTGETAFAVQFWAEVLRVLKPGGHVLAFSGTRTYHRLACAIEDAGFEIRDMVSWIYGSGFPKSHDVSKSLDGVLGRQAKGFKYKGGDLPTNGGSKFRSDHPDYKPYTAATPESAQWSGWGTALKPALEPIVLARKPLIGTVAANVLAHGTGAINVDGCRVAADWETDPKARGWQGRNNGAARFFDESRTLDGKKPEPNSLGRWPANVIHDGSEEVLAGFPDSNSTPYVENNPGVRLHNGGIESRTAGGFSDSGSAARFFYTAKADSDDRIGSKHPTVKPVDLVRYLCRLITPKGGAVLDPFAGTGTTGEAAWLEGFRATLIEREPEYMADIERRMALCMAGPEEKQRAIIKAKGLVEESAGPLFEALI